MMRRKSLFYEQHSEERRDDDDDDDGGEHHHSLHRTLTAVDLMLYGVGCSVGAGIYCLVGIGAQLAGPAISLSFAICGSACIFTSLAYAEFAARIPLTGSAYVYAYVAFGEYWGWLVGWFLTLGYGFTASVVARSWGDYVASFARGVTGWSWLAYLTNFPIYGGYTCSPLSTVIVALCTWVLVSGAKESSRFNNFMTVLNISVLLFVVLAGSSLVEMDNLTPFAPQGIRGISQGAGLVFFAFIGFDMVACLSEEVVQPEINMPIGIVGSLIISATIYVLVSLVVIGMAPIDLLGDKVPIVNALLANACCTHSQQVESNAAMECLSQTCTPVLHKVLAFGGRLVSFGAIFGLTTGTFTSLMGQPRIFYRMAQDGLLFEIFGIVNPNTRVPTGGIIITGVISSLLACFIELESLANMISLGTLMVFTFVDAGVIILRWSPSTDSNASRYAESDDEMEGVNGSHVASLPPPHLYDEDGIQSSLHNWLVWFRGHDVKDNGMKPVVCTLLFTFSSLLASVMIGNHHFVAIMSATVAVVSGILLSILPQSPPPDTFSCPFVPLVPLIGIASNTIMMGSLPIGAWFFTLAWLVIGNAVYFLYGIRHSRLGKQQPPVRMLSLPEAMPLTREDGEVLLGSYESTTTNGDMSDSLEHRLHPSS
jgi:APA family basic amino acid/polyamine antiporter